jgi:glycosyltransferase involved in cell wall biosynthesis
VTPTSTGAARTVAIVVKGYPRLSETFVAQEIRALERRGLSILIVSLRRPTDDRAHPVHAEIHAPVHYLPEYLHQEPARVLRAWRAVRGRPGYAAALALWRRDLTRDCTRNRIRRFGQALVLAHELPPEVAHLHVHFLHTPASVVRYASMLTGLAWTGSAHATDIWTQPEWEKREKLADCRWMVTCTALNRDHLAALAPDAARVELLYHGLDLDRFDAPDVARPSRDGGDSADPVVMLSVGRAVEKKGYDDLIDALARLPADLHWRLEHVGTGPWLARLRAQAGRLGLSERICWLGARDQDEVIERYRHADMFVLACRRAGNGDRDGLPNVVVEAMSQGLPCVSTRISGVPEILDHGVNGLLVDERDVPGLAAALETLARDPARRRRQGAAALCRVHADFSHEAGADRLHAKLAAELRRATAKTVDVPCASPSTHR